MSTRFGPFALSPETRQLFRGSEELHLSPKAFDLLCALVDERPKVLDKRDLLGRIWQDTHVIEANLHVLIAEIRRVLGDNAQQPEFIRTVHGVGFAFSGDAVEVRDGQAAVSAPSRMRSSDQAMVCWLQSSHGTFRLNDGDNVIGRDPRSGVWLDAEGVSRRHATILVDTSNRRVTIEDLGSTNGTFVGRTPVGAARTLNDGDRITVGSVDLRIRLWTGEKMPDTKRIRRR